MPFYFALNIQGASSTTGETDQLRMLTVANQREAIIVGFFGVAASGTAGGVRLRLATFTTPSTVGSGATPTKRDPNAPAASTTAFTLPTAGATRFNQMSIGLPQTGGLGGWTALEPAHALTLLANGGANGNADVFQIATTAAVSFDYTVEFAE